MINQSILQKLREKVRESEINIRLFLIFSSCLSYIFLFLMVIIGNVLAITFNYFITDIENKSYYILYEQIQNSQNYELITILLKFNPDTLFLIMVFSIIFFPLSIKEMTLKLEKKLIKDYDTK
ncbi:TPA: hypothetical protein NV714_002059 [Escherichia coli]|nr:hypothetical protein [Escherichia coli]